MNTFCIELVLVFSACFFPRVELWAIELQMFPSPKTLPWVSYELLWLHIHITGRYCPPFQPLWWGVAHALYPAADEMTVD